MTFGYLHSLVIITNDLLPIVIIIYISILNFYLLHLIYERTL